MFCGCEFVVVEHLESSCVGALFACLDVDCSVVLLG